MAKYDHSNMCKKYFLVLVEDFNTVEKLQTTDDICYMMEIGSI